LPDTVPQVDSYASVVIVALFVVSAAVSWATSRTSRRRMPVAPPGPPADPAGLEGRVRALLVRNRTIAAVKLLRESTGLSLREAKRVVDHMAAGHAMPDPPSGPHATVDLSASPQRPLSTAEFDTRLRALAGAGRKIQAVKELRERTGMPLREAKDHVDRLG
jgi:ribosomal protein L7/L12